MNLFSNPRRQIDVSDTLLALILVDRLRVAIKVGEIKRTFSLPTINLGREKKVIRNLQLRMDETDLGLSTNRSFFSIWGNIISHSRKNEDNRVFAFLGPRGSLTSKELTPLDGNLSAFPFRTLEEAIFLLKRSDSVVTPQRNNSSGSVKISNLLVSEVSGNIKRKVQTKVWHRPSLILMSQLINYHLGTQQYAFQQCSHWLAEVATSKTSFGSTANAFKWCGRMNNLMAFQSGGAGESVCCFPNNETTFLHTSSETDHPYQVGKISGTVLDANDWNIRSLVLRLMQLVLKRSLQMELTPLDGNLSAFLLFCCSEAKVKLCLPFIRFRS